MRDRHVLDYGATIAVGPPAESVQPEGDRGYRGRVSGSPAASASPERVLDVQTSGLVRAIGRSRACRSTSTRGDRHADRGNGAGSPRRCARSWDWSRRRAARSVSRNPTGESRPPARAPGLSRAGGPGDLLEPVGPREPGLAPTRGGTPGGRAGLRKGVHHLPEAEGARQADRRTSRAASSICWRSGARSCPAEVLSWTSRRWARADPGPHIFERSRPSTGWHARAARRANAMAALKHSNRAYSGTGPWRWGLLRGSPREPEVKEASWSRTRRSPEETSGGGRFEGDMRCETHPHSLGRDGAGVGDRRGPAGGSTARLRVEPSSISSTGRNEFVFVIGNIGFRSLSSLEAFLVTRPPARRSAGARAASAWRRASLPRAVWRSSGRSAGSIRSFVLVLRLRRSRPRARGPIHADEPAQHLDQLPPARVMASLLTLFQTSGVREQPSAISVAAPARSAGARHRRGRERPSSSDGSSRTCIPRRREPSRRSSASVASEAIVPAGEIHPVRGLNDSGERRHALRSAGRDGDDGYSNWSARRCSTRGGCRRTGYEMCRDETVDRILVLVFLLAAAAPASR